MTGRFETLVYTDCRPGQGLRGSAGLQFQARSSTDAGVAMPVVQQYLLYEPPSPWMAERRPVETYPVSFAHVHAEGFYATAAGVYLGREANGGRQGNQITHSLVTRDPADYQGLRPAQLFGAPFWTRVPAPTTTSEPVELEAKVAALSPAAARDFVLAQPDGPQTLLALVSALENAGKPGHARVLFVGDDVPGIVQWLAAGTFLVPRARALELGFKIFSTSPSHAGVPVVAVHRDFADPVGRLDSQLGYAVFNVDRPGHSPVPPTASATRWVDLFFAEDPQDVVDALDIAAVSGLADPESDGSDETAAALGLAVVLHRTPPPEHALPIVRWLRTGPEPLRNAYAADVAELFAESPDLWRPEVLVELDEVACDGLVPGRAGSVRLALLHGEVTGVRERAEVTDRRVRQLPDGEWGPEEVALAHRMLVNALGSDLRPRYVDGLLRVAFRYGIEVRYADFPAAAHELVAYWADRPRAGFEPECWPCGTELEDLLVDLLAVRAEAGDREAADIGTDWWRWLLRRATLPPALFAAAIGAGVRLSESRESFVDSQLAAARGAADRYARTVGALWSQTEPSVEELRLVRDRAPRGVALPQRVFSAFVALLCGTGPLEPAHVQLCRDLIDDELLYPPPPLLELLADHRSVLEASDQLVRDVADESEQRAATRRLRRAPERLVRLHESRIVRALVRAPDPYEVVSVLREHPVLVTPCITLLVAALLDRGDERPAAIAVSLRAAMVKGDPTREALGQAVWHWFVRAADDRLEAGRERLAAGAQGQRHWDRFVEVTGGPRRRYRLTHPFRER